MTKTTTRNLLLFAGIMAIALNLRAPLAAIGPLLGFIQSDLGLTATQAGLLTTFPLITFAIFSPVATALALKYGLEVSLKVALAFILAGTVLRTTGSQTALFTGTLIIGAGIAIANVLLPSIVKRDFPHKYGEMTSLYALVMGAGSFIIACIAVPLVDVAKENAVTVVPQWAFPLALMAVIPLAAMLLWLPQLKNRNAAAQNQNGRTSKRKLLRSPAAWLITLYLAINSLITYVMFSWLPTIVVDAGFTPEQAGYVHGAMQLATAVPGIVMIPLMSRFQDKRPLAFCLCSLNLISLLGLMLLPSFAFFWALTFGFGIGAVFILGLSLFGIRTAHPQEAAALSGLSQFIGYLLAAVGPTLIGLLYQSSGSWTLPLSVCCGLAALLCAISLGAARSTPISKVPVEAQDIQLNPAT
ncbi:MFS transporter [Rhodobacteraceae bacterium RKSG542]|uniref:MFS transporter n=1 Tax=Pseudovibrio flavus TaxID=2529854 RepID=UPI0012BCC82C|nr:MFS transporter [Pseudovibrio flavus]MTI15986.1 MFS transporter [Pseudovibrio flavus]